MKKFLLSLIALLICTTTTCYSVEMTVSGKGIAPLTGYNMAVTRANEDAYMNTKAVNSKTELMHTQQIKEATRQAENRKKQDKRMAGAVRGAVVTLAQENADRNAILILVDRVLGPNSSKNSDIQAKLDDLLSQTDDYVLDKNYTGEVIDNNYIAKVNMVVDYTKFKELISDFGIAINNSTVRQNRILVIIDDFFAAPSDMNSNVLTKEVTTYDYKYNEKNKQTEKMSYSDSGNASAYAGYSDRYGRANASAKAGYNTKANYGNFIDYSQNVSEVFQNIREYAPKTPSVQNLNYTQHALLDAFTVYDINAIDNDTFKSTFFGDKQYITSDKLANSEVLAKYIKYAKDEAKVDYFAIGVSYIVDTGINPNTGKHTCDGTVFVKVYSTQNGEVIAAGTLSETAAGNSADQARQIVAEKMGTNLGEPLAKKIETYVKRRLMYGSEYLVEIKGKFLPAERMAINNSLKNSDNIKQVSVKTVDANKLEYTINYNGSEPIGDIIFMQLINASPKFNNYDYKINKNEVIFIPIVGSENL